MICRVPAKDVRSDGRNRLMRELGAGRRAAHGNAERGSVPLASGDAGGRGPSRRPSAARRLGRGVRRAPRQDGTRTARRGRSARSVSDFIYTYIPLSRVVCARVRPLSTRSTPCQLVSHSLTLRVALRRPRPRRPAAGVPSVRVASWSRCTLALSVPNLCHGIVSSSLSLRAPAFAAASRAYNPIQSSSCLSLPPRSSLLAELDPPQLH